MPSVPAPTTLPPIDELRASLDGSVLVPGDDGFDEVASRTFMARDVRPSLIIRATSAADVARAVSFARGSGLELAVRSGGHSGAGHSATDGGLLLDLAGLDGIDLDPASRTVWAGAGLTAAALTTALDAHGLVIGFGDTGSVGIGGITLGGGSGFLVRAHGLTIDNLLAVELVTADGEIRLVDEGSDPELFWALRGGGGNFGVATRFRYQAHALPRITGGMLVLPATPDTIEGFIAAAQAAPDELTAIANVMPAPPMPFIAPEHHGRVVILGLVAYAGEGPAAEAALAPFRALAEPLADMLAPMPYAGLFPPEPGGDHGAPIGVSRTLFTERVDRALAVRILSRIDERMAAGDALMAVAQLRPMGGASARVPDSATAYAHRTRPIMANVAALVTSPEGAPAVLPWVESFAAELSGGDPAGYVNFLGDEGPGRVRSAYPGDTWDRLVAVKRRVDPENLFHRNQNIPPVEAPR